MNTTKDKFDEKHGASHWSNVTGLLDAMFTFGAKVSYQSAYNEDYEQFLIEFPDGSSRLATILNDEL